jgi:nuclear GTP-binding protein
VEAEPFNETFGPKAQRKRPRIDASSFEELGKRGAQAADEADLAHSGPSATSTEILIVWFPPLSNIQPDASGSVPVEPQTHADHIEPIFSKGTSRRIYGELYKVIDSSDVILHILDARDPLGTMCQSVLDYIKKEKSHKQVVLVINKCDLVPNWVTVRVLLTIGNIFGADELVSRQDTCNI